MLLPLSYFAYKLSMTGILFSYKKQNCWNVESGQMGQNKYLFVHAIRILFLEYFISHVSGTDRNQFNGNNFLQMRYQSVMMLSTIIFVGNKLCYFKNVYINSILWWRMRHFCSNFLYTRLHNRKLKNIQPQVFAWKLNVVAVEMR